MEDFGLYVILTNPMLSHEQIAQICVDEGVKMLQLREKHLSDQELLTLGKKITKITKGTQTKFIMNDRADLALLIEADGVHLGQDDVTLKEARQIVGPDMMIGRSTHSLLQSKEAIEEGADYIGFGPIYKTPTKKNPDPTVGTDQLKEVVQFSPVPVVAIGGISPETLQPVLAHSKNFAVVRYLMETEDVKNRISKLQKSLATFFIS
jgi:thiamine-phosphate pyrophosphorylase